MSSSDITQIIDNIRYSGFVVPPAFIDPNGHMNVGYYSVLFDQALDLPWDRLGVGSASTEATGFSTFTLESHVTYQREVHEGDPLDFTFQLIDFDGKNGMRLLHRCSRYERWLAATSKRSRSASTWQHDAAPLGPADRLVLLRALHETHSRRPRPTEIGHRIGIRRK